MVAKNSSATTDAQSPQPPKQVLFWTAIGYALMVLGTIAAFLLIRSYGETLVAPSAVPGEVFAEVAAQKAEVLRHVLVALAAVIITGQLLARLFAYFGQPPVIGEVVAGILLGPSLLGEDISALILPPTVAPFLGVIAQLGVILYMFMVGL
jgi:K+:H+ antiporter